MRSALIAHMQAQGGVIRRDEALARYPVHVVDDALRAGAIVLAHPGVYRLPDREDLNTRRRAALAYCRGGALSHTDALDQWGLPTAATDLVHVTVGPNAAYKSRGVRLHQRRSYTSDSSSAVTRAGLRTVRLEQAIIESWRLLPLVDRRSPAIVAVRDRRTTAQRLLDQLGARPSTPGARTQRRLFELLAIGNHSELELWGHERVFTDKRLPPSAAQHRVQLDTRSVFIDRAFLSEQVAVELDGAAYHDSPGQRERDLRRDAALARLGWLTVRYSHPRLHTDAGGVIEELLEILGTRRAQLAVAG